MRKDSNREFRVCRNCEYCEIIPPGQKGQCDAWHEEIYSHGAPIWHVEVKLDTPTDCEFFEPAATLPSATPLEDEGDINYQQYKEEVKSHE